MIETKIKVLGTTYTIIFNAPEEDLPDGADGCMDHSEKVIRIRNIEPDRDTVKNIGFYITKVTRHEIIHAFLYESGMWSNSGDSEAWAMDEAIVDWIAIQFPKIYEVFREVGCM